MTAVAGREWGRGYSGDGGPATEASLDGPEALALGDDGALYIADSRNNRIRRVDGAGVITTVAGGGVGDGGAAAQAQVRSPRAMALAADGSLYVADMRDNRVRRVDPAGIITTVAGNGSAGYSRDEGPATEAALNHPGGILLDPDGTISIADTDNSCIRRVSREGTITTVVGPGREGELGDGGPARAAYVDKPEGMAVAPDGSLYVADTGNGRVRRVDAAGIITTVASRLASPTDVALAPDGGLYVVENSKHQIQKLDTRGKLETVVGTGKSGFCGDGGPADKACLNMPRSIAVALDGSLYIADTGNHRVRKVSSAGVISTVAGYGADEYCGDGGQAVEAAVPRPIGVAVATDGTLYITSDGGRLRRVDKTGIITTVARPG
jgi:sugar lactone lactonase YvrE